MQVGDNVVVRATGQHARIIEDLGKERYRVLYYQDPNADALDRDLESRGDRSGAARQCHRPGLSLECRGIRARKRE